MNRAFKAGPAYRFALVVALVVAPVFCWWLRHDEASLLVDLFFGAGVVAVFFAWQRTIHFDDEGIWQRDLIWRKHRISWNDVDSLAHLAADGKTIVGGGNVQIVHGTLYRDKQAFCELIEQRTGRHVSVGMWS